ncbi:MAG: hypothetical protein HN379_11120 [Desulfobacteraceae bacterium]|jgi:photosystem II stability/assembly factor-like uncharacterized protein|nr:hypothetical protein [Desulfobacteraceae bacterium]
MAKLLIDNKDIKFVLRKMFFLVLLCFALMLPLPVSSEQGTRPQNPVWMWDYKEVFYDIAFINKQKAVIVGARGQILVSHGTYKDLWSPRDSKTEELLTSLSFIDGKQGWAAGHGGVIIHTADGGETWEVQRETSPENLPLFDIQFVSKNIGYACGAFDTFLKTIDGGKTWKSHPTNLDNIYNGLFFHDAENGFLVGEFGSVLKTTDGGKSWNQMNVDGYQGTLFGITFLSPDKALAYGITGKLIISHDGGENWKDIDPDIKDALFMAAVNGDDVAVVGRTGVMLLSNDGAKSFAIKYEKESHTFAGVCSHPQGGFVGVGEFGNILKIEALKNE